MTVLDVGPTSVYFDNSTCYITVINLIISRRFPEKDAIFTGVKRICSSRLRSASDLSKSNN